MRAWSVVPGTLAIAILAAGCGGGGSGGGGGATAAASTSGTTPGGSSGVPGAQVAAVTSLRLPAGLVLAGDVPVAYRIADPSSAPASVTVSISTDGGATWTPATASASSAATTGLATAPLPGTEHIFTWSSAADVSTSAQVLVRVELAGGNALTASAVVDNVPLTTAVRLNRRPYLQLTRQTSTLIAWRTETDTDSVIEWGDTPALGNLAGNPGVREKAHTAELVGLLPGTLYYYRVVANGAPLTARESFTSAPATTSSDFSFLAFGDSGTLSPAQLTLGTMMAAEDADFAIHMGDVIYPYGGLGNGVGEYNDRFFKPYEAFLGRIPMFPVIGNHDLIAVFGQPFKEAFYLPDNGSSIARELYFSFEWGDAKFIALETTGLFLVPLGDHMRWLQQEIQQNQRKWLIVYMHVPLYSCGSHGDNRILQYVLGPLFENGKVDLVIAGHDHNYERTKPIKQFNQDPAYPGLVHVLTGGGGAGTRGVSPNSRTAVAASVNHYTRFSVQGDTLSGVAVDVNGQVVDSFTVQNIP
jgi:predicted phosphodiesterase